MSNPLSLDNIRKVLIRMEDTIIINLFERQQYKRNLAIYDSSLLTISGNQSFFQYMLREIESVHSKLGRYTSFDEHSFSLNLPEPIITREYEKDPFVQLGLNYNADILYMYLEALDTICVKGDDNNYGYSATWDIEVLQALSRRIHYGLLVAESKYLDDVDGYREIIKAKDNKAIMEKLSNLSVEETIIKRVEEKGNKVGIDGKIISEFYQKKIIPLTKEIELEYLLKR